MLDDAGAVTARPRPQIDPATVVGLVGGFGLVVTAIWIGGSPQSFLNAPAILVVLGGTLCVVTACFSVNEVINTARVLAKTIIRGRRDPTDAAMRVMRTAEIARRQGLLAIQGLLDEMYDEPFLHKGLQLVVDGSPSEDVEAMLSRDIEATVQRHAKSSGVLRKAAEFAPAMGLIGTLIGLVQMLANLSDPSTIGPSMAVALLTTFYGAVLANMVFSPLAAKLERNSGEEALIHAVYLMGAVSIGRQENPRRLEMLLNAVLPPAKRVRFYD